LYNFKKPSQTVLQVLVHYDNCFELESCHWQTPYMEYRSRGD